MRSSRSIMPAPSAPSRSFAAPALIALALAFALPACGSSPKDTTPVADGGEATTPVSSAQSVPTGSNCSSVTESYSTCTDLSSCPGVSIDQTKFTGCGYSVHDDAIDPECLCYGAMCPMGAPTSCADMAALLTTVSLDAVCQQYAGGHCLNLGNSTQTPCSICKQNCGADPACINNCNC
jgi:hypothetical protein